MILRFEEELTDRQKDGWTDGRTDGRFGGFEEFEVAEGSIWTDWAEGAMVAEGARGLSVLSGFSWVRGSKG